MYILRTVIFFLVFSWFYCIGELAFSQSNPPTGTISLSNASQLFLDDALIASKSNIKRVLHPPVKYPNNPVMVREYPWEKRYLQVYGTVIYEPEIDTFRMWYMASQSETSDPETTVCYAESKDGIEWKKPMVGTVEYPGIEKHNIVIKGGHGVSVIKEEKETDPQKRYKALGGNIRATSPDGLHWTVYSFDEAEKNDTSSCLIHWRNRYWAFLRTQGFWNETIRHVIRNLKNNSKQFREVGLCTSGDFETWSLKDPIISPMQSQKEYPWEQPYGISVTPYGDVLIGVIWYLDLDRKRDNFKFGDQYARLAVSRNGRDWALADVNGYFLESTPGAWDRGRLTPATQLVVKGDTVYFYYTSSSARHGVTYGDSAIGVATLPRDRFVSMEPMNNSQPGVLETHPMRMQGKDLIVNADSQSGEIQIELLDAAGKTVAGYEAEKSRLEPVNDLESRVVWNAGETVRGLGGLGLKEPLAIRFHVRKGSLYAFQVEARDGKAVKRTVIPAEEETADDLEAKGKARLDKGQLEIALEYCNRALEKDPKHVAAYNDRAMVHNLKKQYREAVDDLKRALTVDRKNPEIYYTRAMLYHHVRRLDLAIKDLVHAGELDPKTARYFVDLGFFYSMNQSYDSAIQAYTRGLALDPDDLFALYERGTAYVAIQQVTQAMADLNEAVLLRPDEPVVYNNRARAYLLLKDNKRAMEDLNHAIDLGATFGQPYATRGRLLFKLGHTEEAFTDIRKAIEIKPDDAKYYYNYGYMHEQTNDLQLALDNYSQCVQLDPSNAEYRYRKGRMLAALGNYEESLPDLNQAIVLNPDYSEAYKVRAIVLTTLQRFEPAIRDLQKILPEDPSFAHLWLATCYCSRIPKQTDVQKQSEDINAALDHLEQLILSNPEYRQSLKDNPAFAIIINHPRIQRLLQN